MKPIGLIACCKTKLEHRAPARYLYIGALFRKAAAWIEPRTDGWAILSAKHGVVLPDTELDPYEEALVGAPWKDVQAWHVRTNKQLRAMFPGRSFIVIAGHEYLGAVVGLPFTNAFGSMPIGRKMQAIGRELVGGVRA